MKYIFRSLEAFLLALLLAFIFIFFFHEDQAGEFGGIVFIAGLVLFAVLLFRSSPRRVHFHFCLIFGTEWLLLPAIAYINLQFRSDTFGEVLGNIVFFGLLTGAGIIAGVIFLSIATLLYVRGRKKEL